MPYRLLPAVSHGPLGRTVDPLHRRRCRGSRRLPLRLAAALFGLGLALASAGPARAQLVPDGPLVDVGGFAAGIDAGNAQAVRVFPGEDGGFTVLWNSQSSADPRWLARSFDAAGTALEEAWDLPTSDVPEARLVAFDLAGDRLAMAWKEQGTLLLRVFDSQGTPLTETRTLLPVIQDSLETFGVGRSDIAITADGGLAVAWEQQFETPDFEQFHQAIARRYDATLEAVQTRVLQTGAFQPQVAVVADPEGGFAVVSEWIGIDGVSGSLLIDRFDADGSTSRPQFGRPGDGSPGEYLGEAVFGADGHLVVAYDDDGGQVADGRDGSCSGVFARVLDPGSDRFHLGQPLHRAFLGCQWQASVAAMGSNFALAYLGGDVTFEADGFDGADAGVYVRAFSDELLPFGEPVRVLPPSVNQRFDLAAGDGRAVVATVVRRAPEAGAGNGDTEARVVVQRLAWAADAAPQGAPVAASCDTPAEAGPLCFQEGRFRADVAFRNPYVPDVSPTPGIARAAPFEGDTSGTLWFFREANRELMVKVLDGRAENDHWWVFWGGLSTVEYWITVTDLETGAQHRAYNPPFAQSSAADTEALPAGGEEAAGGELGAAPVAVPGPRASRPPAVAREAEEGPVPPVFVCRPRDINLCLHRFTVIVDWRDPRTGDTGVGRAVPITDDTGAFTFFRDDNAELLVKILDGRAVNGYWWVFYAGLTDVEFTLTVIPETQAPVTYTKPPFVFGGGADTRAIDGSGGAAPSLP